MLSEELISIVENIKRIKAEKQNIEVKAAFNGCPKRLYDTLSSFSNQENGGILLFGLDESKDFEIVGVYDIQDLQKKVTEQCNQMIPPVKAVFTVAEIGDKLICSAEIPAINIVERPCYYSGAGITKGSYIRVGDADMPMTDYEIYSYEAFRRHQHDDIRGVENADFSYLDKNKLDYYMTQMKLNRPGFDRLNPQQAFEMAAVTNSGKPTLAAVMNFGLYPQGFFQQLAITAVVVPGEELGAVTSSDERFVDNKRIDGTLKDMLQDAMAFCIRNIKTRTIINKITGQREDKTEYPLQAVREIVLNALIHRDYSHFTEGTPIQILFFNNRLEVHSPGGLYGRLSVEDLGKVRPDLRNPALATMFEFMLNTENRYSGIPTIRREMQAFGLKEPVFENRRNEFVVTLYNDTEKQEEVKPTESIDILEFCKVPRTRREIADYLKLGTTIYVTRTFIMPLVKAGKLFMTIPDKPRSKNQKYYSI